MDQLDEARNIALLRSAKYQQSVAPVPRPSGVGLGLQHQGLGAPPRLEQQEPPQALSAMGGTICHHGGASARRLQVQDHRR